MVFLGRNNLNVPEPCNRHISPIMLNKIQGAISNSKQISFRHR